MKTLKTILSILILTALFTAMLAVSFKVIPEDGSAQVAATATESGFSRIRLDTSVPRTRVPTRTAQPTRTSIVPPIVTPTGTLPVCFPDCRPRIAGTSQ